MFELSDLQKRDGFNWMVSLMGWLFLLAVVVATGVHAVTLVISQVGLTVGVMGAIRVVSPVLVEVGAVVVAVGFAVHRWQERQKLVGAAIEIIWVIFAGLNLVTSFTLEAGYELSGPLWLWLHYGLPLSALVVGALFYAMLRVDPEARRQAELKATQEALTMAEFTAKRAVLTSPQMAGVLRQRGWLTVVQDLERAGYTAEQIDYMTQGVPQLAPGTPVAPEGDPEDLEAGSAQQGAKLTPVPLSENGHTVPTAEPE